MALTPRHLSSSASACWSRLMANVAAVRRCRSGDVGSAAVTMRFGVFAQLDGAHGPRLLLERSLRGADPSTPLFAPRIGPRGYLPCAAISPMAMRIDACAPTASAPGASTPRSRAVAQRPHPRHLLARPSTVLDARALAGASTCPSTTEVWCAQAPPCPRSPLRRRSAPADP